MEQNAAIRKRIKELMEQRGMNYNMLAEASGLPWKRAYRLANGMVSNPGVFLMMKLCEALGVTLDEFFDTEEFRNLENIRV